MRDIREVKAIPEQFKHGSESCNYMYVAKNFKDINSLVANCNLNDRGSFDRNSLDRNCVLSVDRNFHNQLTEFF